MTVHSSLDPFDVRRLLAPVGMERFFAEHWQKRMLSFDLAQDDFQRILSEIGPLDIARLAGLALQGTKAWIANDYVKHSVIPVTAANAADFMAIGATLYFHDVPLERLTHGLADVLGVPRAMVHASFFLTPATGGAAPHFDANETFTVQLTGFKRWLLSAAPMVEGAPDVYTLGNDPPPTLDGLLGEVPGGPELVAELKPGTFLYVPRGVVHRTEGGEASWSLSLSYDRTMWLELFCKGLAQRLGQSARWRGSVAGVGAGADPGARSANIVPELAEELRALLDDPAEIEQVCRMFFEAPG